MEKQTEDAFLGLLEAFSSPMDKERVERIKHFMHPNCNGFGTSPQEIFTSRAEWLKLFEEELIQLPHGLEVTHRWMNTFPIDASTVGLSAEVAFRLYMPKHDILIEPTRMSAIFTLEGDRPLLRHFHVSLPYGEDMEEIFPGSKEPRLYEDVSVMFTDFVGFTNVVATIPPKKLVSELNDLFAQFDQISEDHGLSKIKTTGDAYMAIAGMEGRAEHHGKQAVKAGLAMLKHLRQRNSESPVKWDMRIGIHSGSVIGGVIGRNKRQFDVWGDTVNIASRLQSMGEKGKINVSAYTYELIRDDFPCAYRGKLSVKGKGEMDMYFVVEESL